MTAEIEGLIRDAAQKRGIDGDTAVKVAKSESGPADLWFSMIPSRVTGVAQPPNIEWLGVVMVGGRDRTGLAAPLADCRPYEYAALDSTMNGHRGSNDRPVLFGTLHSLLGAVLRLVSGNGDSVCLTVARHPCRRLVLMAEIVGRASSVVARLATILIPRSFAGATRKPADRFDFITRRAKARGILIGHRATPRCRPRPLTRLRGLSAIWIVP